MAVPYPTLQIKAAYDQAIFQIPDSPSVVVAGLTFRGASVYVTRFSRAEIGVNYAGGNSPGVAF